MSKISPLRLGNFSVSIRPPASLCFGLLYWRLEHFIYNAVTDGLFRGQEEVAVCIALDDLNWLTGSARKEIVEGILKPQDFFRHNFNVVA